MRAALLVALLCTLPPLLGLADPATDPGAAAPAAADPTVATLMAQAQRAYVAADYDTAKDLFGQVVELDPQNTMAIRFLRAIRARQAGKPSPPPSPFESLVLAKVELREATFSSALDFFKQKAADQSVTVSFVPQLPPAQMAHTVSLSLSKIPFLDALRYLCQLNNASYKVEPYAIVIVPVSDTPAPESAAPPQ
jgi:hypothetical protein